jgi:hypothetical protein
MNEHGRSQRLDLLVLARVAGGSSPVSPSKVRDSILRFAGADRSPAERRHEIEARIDDLVARGLLTRKPLTVSDEGRKWLCGGLGVDSPPPWKVACERLAPMLALGLLPGSKEAQHTFASTAQVQAEVIARGFGLRLSRPTVAQVLNALTALALETHQPVKSTRDLRPMLAELWVERERWEPDVKATARPVPLPVAPASPPLGLDELAAAVRVTAAEERTGRFGDRKVFISALHRRLTSLDPRFEHMTLEDFKARLVEANARRLLTLARADYVSAMDTAEVTASHVHDLGSDFHFVLDEEGR